MPHPIITTPESTQSTAMLEFRVAVLREELNNYGNVSQAAIATQLAAWPSAALEASYRWRIEGYLQHPDQTFLRIVSLGEKVAGICVGQFATEQKPFHFLQSLQIHSTLRRQGYGTKLIEMFEDNADPDLPMKLGVFEHNEPAISLYTRLGFTVTGKKIEHIGNPPEASTILRMIKPKRSIT